MRTRSDSPTKTCTVEGCERPLRARGMCGTHYNQTRYTASERHKPTPTICYVCGKPTISRSSVNYERKVCSYECRWFLQNPGLACEIPESHPAHHRWADPGILLPVAWHPLPATFEARPACSTPRIDWVAGRCRYCSAPFVDRWLAGQSSQTCSARCAKAIGKHRRRARKREAYVADVSPRKIYERDGWRCRIKGCGRPVKRDAVVPHPLAPTIDHIIPLAKGGTHEPANVQCAHFKCNAIKSDQLGNVQLMLVG